MRRRSLAWNLWPKSIEKNIIWIQSTLSNLIHNATSVYVKDLEIVVNQSLVGKVCPCGLVSNVGCVDPGGRIFFFYSWVCRRKIFFLTRDKTLTEPQVVYSGLETMITTNLDILIAKERVLATSADLCIGVRTGLLTFNSSIVEKDARLLRNSPIVKEMNIMR